MDRVSKNFRYWLVSDVQVPSQTEDRFVYSRYKNQLVVSVPNTGGFNLTNMEHPAYSDLVVFSVMKSFQPELNYSNDVLTNIPDWVMSFELWHFLAHLSGVFESDLTLDTFLSNFEYETSWDRERVRYPEQGVSRTWYSNEIAWETKAAFFVDIFLMISKPAWLELDSPKDHHYASLAPSQSIQAENDADNLSHHRTRHTRPKRLVGHRTSKSPEAEEGEEEEEEEAFSQHVYTRDIGYISDLMPDLVARCTLMMMEPTTLKILSRLSRILSNLVFFPLIEDNVAKRELDRVLSSWNLIV